MGARQVINLTPDGSNLGGSAAVNAQTLIKDEVAEGLPLLVTELAVNHHLLFLDFLLSQSKGLDGLGLDGLEAVLTLVLGLG